MADPRLNPNADPEERKRLMMPLIGDLKDVLRKHAVPMAAVAEDFPILLRSLMACFFLAVLEIQVSDPDKTLTLKDHMTNQFMSAKAAFAMMAERNAEKWNKPVEMESKG